MAVTINGSEGVTTNSGAVYDGLQRGTAVASTSGTAIDFTGIPSWVKRITVMFNGVSSNGTGRIQLQLGTSGGIESTGYISQNFNTYDGGTLNVGIQTASFQLSGTNVGANLWYGQVILSNLSGNTWTEYHCLVPDTSSANARLGIGGGAVTLSDVLNRVRIIAGTDTFDAGTINIMYE